MSCKPAVSIHFLAAVSYYRDISEAAVSVT